MSTTEAADASNLPLEILQEYNQYTQPVSIADTYVAPDMVDGFLWALFFNGLTLTLILATFMMIRKPCRDVFSARIVSKLRFDEYDGNYYVNLNRLIHPSSYFYRCAPPSQDFSETRNWLAFLFRHSEEQIFHDLGLDEAVMTKVMVLAMEIFSVILVLNLPLYAYFAFDHNTHFEWNHSMADVEHGSWILWIYFCFVWIKSLVCLYYLWRHTKSYVSLRQRYLVSGVRALPRFDDTVVTPEDRRLMVVHKRSVYIDHIPRGKRTEENIRDLFDRGIWKGRIRSVYVKRRTESKESHGAKVSTVKTRRAEKKPARSSPTTAGGLADDGKKKRDAAFTTTLHGERVSWNDLYEEYVSWRKLPSNDSKSSRLGIFHDRPRVPTYSSPRADAIVVFDNAYTANVASQISFTVDSGLRTRLAPSPSNVYEGNVGYHGWAGFDARFFCSVLFYVTLLLFWAVPVGLVASLTSIDSLEQSYSWLDDLREHPWLFDILETYLPTVGLYLFMALLPYILEYASKFEGLKTKSAMNQVLMIRYFVFLLLNVLLVASLSGGIFAILYSVSSDGGLSDIPELLGKSLPNMYLFFVSYVMLQAMTILPMDLLRIPSLISRCLNRNGGGDDDDDNDGGETEDTDNNNDDDDDDDCRRFSSRDRTRAAQHRSHDSGELLARHLLVFCISLVYSSFTPLMLPFSLFYFGFGLLLHRHEAYYVYAKPYESGGDMWLNVIHCVVVGVMVYILAIMGMILLLDGIMEAFFLTPLLFVVMGSHYLIRVKYGNLMKHMALSSTLEHDSNGEYVAANRRRNPAIIEDDSSINTRTTKTAEDDEFSPLLAIDDGADDAAESGDHENESSIAFRAYASEFGGVFGSVDQTRFTRVKAD